jgi:hypothetical protein
MAKKVKKTEDELTKSTPEAFVVRGQIRQTDGSLLVGGIVRAFDKDLRSEQLLGEATTDKDGRYEITYTATKFQRAEKKSADVAVRVFSKKGEELVSSKIIFNAKPVETVDLVIGGGEYRGPSEYERLVAEIKPLLQGLAFAELSEDEKHQDITFLSGETEQDLQRIMFLVLAHRFKEKTGLVAEVFYGLFREGLPTDLPALVAQGPRAHQRALEAALRDNIIPARLGGELDQILQRLQALQVEQPVFLTRPEVLYSRLADLGNLTQEQADFVAARLNEHLRREILKAVGMRDEPLSRAVQAATARIDYRRFKDATLSHVIREGVLEELRKDTRPAPAIAEVEKRLADMPSRKVNDLLHLEVALQNNPIFVADLRRAKAVEYARLANLDDRAALKLVQKNLGPKDISETALAELVEEGVLNEAQRADLKLALDLGRLTGDNFALITALKSQDLKSVADFVGWEKADWQSMIIGEGLTLPPGETAESYADNILFNIERTYPSQVLFSRLLSPKQKTRLGALDAVNMLLHDNERLIDGARPAALDWKGVSVQQREILEKQLQDLVAFTNTYRHLGVVDLINDRSLDLDQKKGTIEARLQLLDTFYRDNPDLDLRRVNLAGKGDGHLNWQHSPEAERPRVKKQLRAYQRMLYLASDTADRQMLLSKGYDSATTIALTTEEKFVRASGLERGKARMTYAMAMDRAVSVSHYYETIRDAVRGDFKHIAMGNQQPVLVNDLRDIDGFDDLFGPQDYCDCEHCRSILSPAAYFVDLMYFVEQHISRPVFIDPHEENHPLYLKNRRSDLWTLPLTCENTNTLVPYLTIVNEVLERYLKAVVVGDVFETLADRDEKRSFGLPFNLALAELRLYLSHFGITLHDIYRILEEPEEKIWRARLNLSQEEFAVITEPDIAEVESRFGNPDSLPDFLVDFPVQDFIRLAGISREQLDELLMLRFNPDLRHIDIDHESDPDELQNFPETLKRLNKSRLDFIHRFIRLWKKTAWSIPDLDLVLTALKDGELIGSDLDTDAVLYVAQLVDIQEKLKLTVDELCALVDQLPISKELEDSNSLPTRQADWRLYERLFDLKKLFGVNPDTHEINTSATFHHYSLNTDNPDDQEIDEKTPLLLGGLGISETELLLLFDLLKDEMPFNEVGNTTLDRRRMSLLYRHARLDKALKLSIEDFIQALRLIFSPDSLVITTIEQIRQIQEFREWLRTSPFTVSTLRFILKGEESGAVKYKTKLEAGGKIVQEVQASPPEVDRVDALKAILSRHFNLRSSQLDHTLQWAATDIYGDGVRTALNATFTEGTPDNEAELVGLLDLTEQIERVLLLFDSLKFKEETAAYLTGSPNVLGIGDLKNLTLDDLKALAFYRQQAMLVAEAEPHVQAVLNSFVGNGVDVVRLADLWRQDESLVESLTNSPALPDVPIRALQALWKRLNLCRTLGVNGYSLQKLAPLDESYADLLQARYVALGAFSSKYEDEKVRQEKLEPYQDRINVIKRDALCDYIIARERDLKFYDLRDIYGFFLLDVEMSGCFRTSRVVCAISSLQLYVHRCLVNLEQSDPELNPDIPDIKVDPALIPAEEWEWRKNYRVWEANRKVFLYPENYLEPDLRDNKTPIFKELEDELLQEKITMESAEAAYKKYVAQFAQLARLRIVGSYYHRGTSTYYFFGRTPQDPPQYYYRKWVDNTVWTPWEKIELAINAPYVTAIVHLGRLYLFWVTFTETKNTTIVDGKQEDRGYTYTIHVNYSYLNEQGRWIASQRLVLKDAVENEKKSLSDLLQLYPFVFPGTVDGYIVLAYFYRWKPRDMLTLFEVPLVRTLDLFNSLLVPRIARDGRDPLPDYLMVHTSAPILGIDTSANRSVAVERFYLDDEDSEATVNAKISTIDDEYSPPDFDGSPITSSFDARDPERQRPDICIVGRSDVDFIFTIGNQQYLIRRNLVQYRARSGKTAGHSFIRLSTSVADPLGEILFTQGLDKLLSLETQQTHREAGLVDLDIEILEADEYEVPSNPDHIDLDGPYGQYYWELFFHTPFLIANHLNANQKFKEARWWYERIFDPTASEPPDDANPNDRNWRYLEFRGRTIETMKDILTDQSAIDQYKKDPFNPHAIARLRLSAYQKAIVMKYIDNLLDWGDYLFAQDTTESINEATMLYVLAADILGKRPVKLGRCATARDQDLTYERLGPAIDSGSEFLLTLENLNLADSVVLDFGGGAPRVSPMDDLIQGRHRFGEVIREWENAEPIGGHPNVILARQSTLAFCVPPNVNLLGYWDRVEDRLFKIRHCMNISGVRRALALFAPPIEPMALVRARAAGLSLEDILGMLAAPLPPYRFGYLIEKAKQFTQTVQSFGNALLSALEKKDGEELTLLRAVHERNILRMTKDIKKQQLSEAQYQLQAMAEAKANVQNRIDYYQGLIDAGLTGWEVTQQGASRQGKSFMELVGVNRILAAIFYLIPEVGSPFAMKFGGPQLGDSTKEWADWFATMASVANAISASAGLEASFQRREEEWDEQLLLAQKEFDQVEQQRLAADARVQIALEDLEIHEKNVEQADELDEFYKNKFTNLGLYTYLSTTLNRLYREAYNVAYDMAMMAQQAYQFERDDDTRDFITGDNWQPDRAGLLAGERLLLQLQQIEKAYLVAHKRDYEVTQPFSLALLNPSELIKLRETGSCQFTIPEIVFDLYYPGQYKRIIKSVRMTIPCVAGPYTNISAKLTLAGSHVRKTPTTDDLIGLPYPPQTSIATSTAQSDGGLFELNFRDERYLPFEGAGAISTWKLEMPAKIRMFDYDTISDVIIHISYTAKDDGEFRTEVEAQIENALELFASDPGLYRLFSLRHEFSNAFYRLLNPQPGSAQTTEFEVTKQHFPYFLADRAQDLRLSETTVYLKPKGTGSVDTSGLTLSVNDSYVSGDWSILPDTNLKEGNISLSGNPIGPWTINAAVDGLDKEELDDILILLKYTISS